MKMAIFFKVEDNDDFFLGFEVAIFEKPSKSLQEGIEIEIHLDDH